MPPENQKRQIAYKVRIKELINGKYVKEEGWQPNYIITQDNKQISRINLIGTVVSTPDDEEINYQSITLDDGTGRISARVFEQNNFFNNINMGDVVLIIARPREYNNQIYLLPEILKKIKDNGWIKVRELELKQQPKIEDTKTEETKLSNESEKLPKGGLEKSQTFQKEEIIEESIPDKIINFIKEKDKGEGVDFEEVLKQINNEEAIKELLKKGELFEIRLGRLKVLE
jgi:RPA family protein